MVTLKKGFPLTGYEPISLYSLLLFCPNILNLQNLNFCLNYGKDKTDKF